MKKPNLFKILLFLHIVSPLCLWSTDTSGIKLSMKDAIDMAIKHHEDVKIAEINNEKFEYQYKEARSYAYPKIDANIDWYNYLKSPLLIADLGAPIGTIRAEMKQPYELVMGVTLKQPIWTFGKISAALDVADYARDISNTSIKKSKEDVAYTVKILYNTVLFTNEAVLIAEKSYRNAIQNKRKLRKKFKYGRAPRYDNIKMSADIASRIPTVIQMKNRHKLAVKNLISFIGLNDYIEPELTDKLKTHFPKYVVKDSLERMIDTEYTLKLMKSRITLDNNIAKLKKSDFYPSIGGFASYQYTGNSNKTFIGSDLMYHSFMVGISITFNLWDSGERRSIYNQALADLEISKLNYSKVSKVMKLQLESAIFDYESSIETYDANKEALKLARQSYDISLSSYESGQLNQTQLNDTELMLTGAELNTLQTLLNINNNIVQIEKLTLKGI